MLGDGHEGLGLNPDCPYAFFRLHQHLISYVCAVANQHAASHLHADCHPHRGPTYRYTYFHTGSHSCPNPDCDTATHRHSDPNASNSYNFTHRHTNSHVYNDAHFDSYPYLRCNTYFNTHAIPFRHTNADSHKYLNPCPNSHQHPDSYTLSNRSPDRHTYIYADHNADTDSHVYSHSDCYGNSRSSD